MTKLHIAAKILYGLSVIFYVTFFCTQENIFMLLGGLILVAASITLLKANKNTNKR